MVEWGHDGMDGSSNHAYLHSHSLLHSSVKELRKYASMSLRWLFTVAHYLKVPRAITTYPTRWTFTFFCSILVRPCKLHPYSPVCGWLEWHIFVFCQCQPCVSVSVCACWTFRHGLLHALVLKRCSLSFFLWSPSTLPFFLDHQHHQTVFSPQKPAAPSFFCCSFFLFFCIHSPETVVHEVLK